MRLIYGGLALACLDLILWVIARLRLADCDIYAPCDGGGNGMGYIGRWNYKCRDGWVGTALESVGEKSEILRLPSKCNRKGGSAATRLLAFLRPAESLRPVIGAMSPIGQYRDCRHNFDFWWPRFGY